MLWSCKEEPQQPQGPSWAQYEAVIAENDSLTAHLTDMNDALQAISLSLDSIDMQENKLFMSNEDGTKASRKQILARIRDYRELLVRQREQIARLEHADNAAVRQLKGVIETLRQEIQQKEEHIAALEQEINNNKRDISKLQSDLTHTRTVANQNAIQRDSLQQINEQQEDELNSAYYIVGSKAMLKRAGIVAGTFKTKVDYANINKERLTKIDTRNFRELVIRGTGVKLLTEKPVNSYIMFENSGGNTVLRITDSKRFWENSPYLILQSK